MITRWRLDEGNKRAKKRYYAFYGSWPSISGAEPFDKDRAIGKYRKTTKLCSCWFCTGSWRETPIPRDIRRMLEDE